MLYVSKILPIWKICKELVTRLSHRTVFSSPAILLECWSHWNLSLSLIKLNVTIFFNCIWTEFTKKVLLIPRDHKEAGRRSAGLSPRHAYVANGEHPKPSTRGWIGKQVSLHQCKSAFEFKVTCTISKDTENPSKYFRRARQYFP